MGDVITLHPVTGTIGVRLEGFDARSIDEGAAAVLRGALDDHHVVVLPAQSISDDEHRRLAEVFGAPHVHPVAQWMGSTDVIAYVTNDADNPPLGDSDFHTDYTFHHEIAAVAVLQAQAVTERGGDTVWSDMHAAHDALSPALRDWLGTLSAHHRMAPRFGEVMRQRYGDELGESVMVEFGGSVHPVVVRHPRTGRPALFVNPGYTDRIVGLEPKESDALLRFLFDHLTQPRFHYRHHWAVDDIVIWDEVATVHQGPDDFWPERRVLRRVCAGVTVPRALDGTGAAGA